MKSVKVGLLPADPHFETVKVTSQSEIAEMLGVSDNEFWASIAGKPDFPVPHLFMLFDAAEVEQWRQKNADNHEPKGV